MKKKIVSLVLLVNTFSSIVCDYFNYKRNNCAPCAQISPQCVMPTKNYTSMGDDREKIGQHLLNLLKQKDPRPFQRFLTQLFEQYRGNKEGFFAIINTRDKDGYNILLFSAIIGDYENLSFIYTILEKFYQHDKEGFFHYIDQRNNDGDSALTSSTYHSITGIVEIIIMRTLEVLKDNKELFFKFLTAADYKLGWQALMSMTGDSESYNMQILVKSAAFVLGKDSDLFNRFINPKDREGFGLFDYVRNDNDRLFLLSYGAQENKQSNPLLEKAHQFGAQLVKAARFVDFNLGKKIIQQAIEVLKNSSDMLYHFFATRDKDGWNAIMHAAANGHYEFIQLIVESFEKAVPQKDISFLFILLSDRNIFGQTPLHIAVFRRQYREATYVIEKLIKYTSNKIDVFYVIISQGFLVGFTALAYLVYGSFEFDGEAFKFLKKFLEKMDEFFNKNSRMFWLFINARDYNGETPLAYASDKRIRLLLQNYGAIDGALKPVRGMGLFEKLILYNNEL